MFADLDSSSDGTNSALFVPIEPIPFTGPSTSNTSSYSAESTRNGLEDLFLPVDSSYRHPTMRHSVSTPVQRLRSSMNGSDSLSRTTYSCGVEPLVNPRPKARRSSAKPQNCAQVLTKEKARRLKNRESAAKSRQRAHETIRALEDTLTELQQRHEFLQNELQRLLEQRGMDEVTSAWAR